MENTHEQTTLTRQKGRPEYGRKLVNNDYLWADNQRKSRSVWTTKAENDVLKTIMEIIKYDPDYKNITIGDILAWYIKAHKQSKITEKEGKPWRYKPFAKS